MKKSNFLFFVILFLGSCFIFEQFSFSQEYPSFKQVMKDLMANQTGKDQAGLNIPWNLGHKDADFSAGWTTGYKNAKKYLGQAPDMAFIDYEIEFKPGSDGNVQALSIRQIYYKKNVTSGPYVLDDVLMQLITKSVADVPDKNALKEMAITYINKDAASVFMPKDRIGVINILEFEVEETSITAEDANTVKFNMKMYTEYAVRDYRSLQTKFIEYRRGVFSFVAEKNSDGKFEVTRTEGGSLDSENKKIEKPESGDYLSKEYSPIGICKYEELFKKRKELNDISVLQGVLGK